MPGCAHALLKRLMNQNGSSARCCTRQADALTRPWQMRAGVGIAPQGVNIQPSIIYISPYGLNIAPQGAALNSLFPGKKGAQLHAVWWPNGGAPHACNQRCANCFCSRMVWQGQRHAPRPK